MRYTSPENFDYHSGRESGDNYSEVVLAPLPGTVQHIKVTEGQYVHSGDLLLTIESMKLENAILAHNSGLISKIIIKTGDKVKKDEPLILFKHSIIN